MIALSLLLLAQAVASPLSEPPLAAEPVPDPVLAEQRGGFRLPSGIDVALTVQTQTAVNGAVLLRTVFQIDQGKPQLTIMAPRSGESPVPGTATAGRSAASASPTVTYDRVGGLQVTPAVSQPAITLSAQPSLSDSPPDGLATVSAGTVTDAGTVTEADRNGVHAISLEGADLTITHLTGTVFGSAIANSGNDRGIDTQTTVSIGLSNAGPDVLGSAMFRVQDIALGAVAMRGN